VETAPGELSLDQLRAERDDLREEEARLSFTRRLLQGQLDILRDHGPDDETLSERLADVLADSPGGGGPARAMDLAPPDDVDVPGLPDLESLDDGATLALAQDLADREAEVSARRRTVLDRLDALQGELVRRYREDGVDVAVVVQDGS